RTDTAPGRVLSNAAVVAAARAPAGTELGSLPEFAPRQARRHLNRWRAAVARAHRLPEAELPPHRATPEPGVLPPRRSWPERNPAAAAHLEAVREVVQARAAELEVPQE